MHVTIKGQLLKSRLLGECELPFPVFEGAWVAGGWPRRLLAGHKQDSDIDLFFRSEEALAAQRSSLVSAGFAKRCETHAMEELTRDKQRVQLIKIGFYQKPEDILESFDFTITQFAIVGDDILTTDAAMVDLARRRLVVHKITYPVASIRRLQKYIRQGFTCCDGTIKQILLSAQGIPENDPRLALGYID